MTQNYRIKQLEERIEFLQNLILQQVGQGFNRQNTNVTLAGSQVKEGKWCVFVKNLPGGLTWKEVQHKVFTLYSKQISGTMQGDNGEWILQFKTKEDAQACASKYRNAKVNDQVITCFVKLVSNDIEQSTKRVTGMVFKKKRISRNKRKGGKFGETMTY